jgi:hypothetical protein
MNMANDQGFSYIQQATPEYAELLKRAAAELEPAVNVDVFPVDSDYERSEAALIWDDWKAERQRREALQNFHAEDGQEIPIPAGAEVTKSALASGRLIVKIASGQPGLANMQGFWDRVKALKAESQV